jgi:hypothetical protein
VKVAGMAIPNPITSAEINYRDSTLAGLLSLDSCSSRAGNLQSKQAQDRRDLYGGHPCMHRSKGGGIRIYIYRIIARMGLFEEKRHRYMVDNSIDIRQKY